MHPYSDLPSSSRWRASVARPAYHDVDPVNDLPFRITRSTKIATAGSCFAQHIARHLGASGYNYFVTEPPHPLMSETIARKLSYGTFSTRYGNLYTAKQLIQLFQRAYGEFSPKDSIWRNDAGRFVDALRPTILPSGYVSEEECLNDRSYHLKAVRRLFEECDIFVFTLGLTECWISNLDGTVYPVCPGVSGGVFSASDYSFKNFTAKEVYDDLAAFYGKLLSVNPDARVLLTVSPVPLVASASGNHVLSATTYSKACLRVAAEQFIADFPSCGYFPSYEVITGSYNRGRYFAEDLRSVTEEGVQHVMRLFFKHMTDESEMLRPEIAAPSLIDKHQEIMKAVVETNCDEEALDRTSS
ncbi:MAG: GSCFA domain-containing protein [Xanthobacteraceae bacterium]|nr:GSCFA domain-containing protein [Xanthobacteraceae bacterium]